MDGAHIYDANGSLIASYSLRRPSWLDASHVVGIDPAAGHIRALITDIRTGDTEFFGLPHSAEDAIANGHGAVAFSWARDDDWPDTHYSFVVWQEGDFTGANDGYAQQWSPDGSTLALFHQFGRNRAPSGWVSVVSWPTLGFLFADAPPYATGDVLFDPTGQYVAYSTSLGVRPEDDVLLVRVVHLETAATTDLPRDNIGGFYWTAEGDIAVIRADGEMTTYTTAGEAVETVTGVPLTVIASSEDGSTVASWELDEQDEFDTIRIARLGQISELHVPDAAANAWLSPDGKLLVIAASGYKWYLRVL